MDLPDLVVETMGDEEPTASVDIGGEDAVVVTGARTLVYRSEGILSDETVEEYPHDAARVDLREGRRKTTFELEYVDRTSEFTVPSDATERVLTPLLAGVLRTKGVLDDDESVADVFRFSELTLVVAEKRLLKHVGAVVWGDEHEELHYDDVTGFAVEEGSVATQLVVEVDGRPVRIKTPNETAGTVRRTVEQALFSYRDVSSAEELTVSEADDAAGDAEGPDASEAVSGDYDFDSLVGDDADADADANTADQADDVRAVVTTRGSSADSSDAPAAVAEEVAALRETVERQNELLQHQQETIEQLIDELRRGR